MRLTISAPSGVYLARHHQSHGRQAGESLQIEKLVIAEMFEGVGKRIDRGRHQILPGQGFGGGGLGRRGRRRGGPNDRQAERQQGYQMDLAPAGHCNSAASA